MTPAEADPFGKTASHMTPSANTEGSDEDVEASVNLNLVALQGGIKQRRIARYLVAVMKLLTRKLPKKEEEGVVKLVAEEGVNDTRTALCGSLSLSCELSSSVFSISAPCLQWRTCGTCIILCGKVML